MDLRRLRYFVVVAEERHFGRAAQRLHITPSPLSQRIRELEEELGVAVFERTSRVVRLTEAGERLLTEARAVIAAADRLESVATGLRSTGGGLVLAYCHGSEHLALTAAQRFRATHPEIAVRPAGFTSLRTFRDLRDRRATIGIVRPPVPYADLLAWQPLAKVPFDHVAVPESHPLARSSVVHASDLEGEEVLLVERDDAPTYHDATVGYCAGLGVHPRWVMHPASQVERMLDMVAVGSGIGWLNAWQAARVHREGVAIVALAPVQRYDEFVLVRRIDDHSPVTTAFIETALEAAR